MPVMAQQMMRTRAIGGMQAFGAAGAAPPTPPSASMPASPKKAAPARAEEKARRSAGGGLFDAVKGYFKKEAAPRDADDEGGRADDVFEEPAANQGESPAPEWRRMRPWKA